MTAPASQAGTAFRNLTVFAAAPTTFRAAVTLFRDVDGKLASLEPVGDRQTGRGIFGVDLCPQAPEVVLGVVACAKFGWVQPGQTYAVAVGGYNYQVVGGREQGGGGSFTLSWSF